jgi:hypothetical protein
LLQPAEGGINGLPPEVALADWYVFQHDGDYLGPWPTSVVAGAILGGKLGPDVWVAAPGGLRWLRALDVPAIARLVEGGEIGPRRRESGARAMPGISKIAPVSGQRDGVEQTLEIPKLDLDAPRVRVAPRARELSRRGRA